jgi:hypothetical protein
MELSVQFASPAVVQNTEKMFETIREFTALSFRSTGTCFSDSTTCFTGDYGEKQLVLPFLRRFTHFLAASEVVVNDVNFDAPSGKYCDYDSSSTSVNDCFAFTTPAIVSGRSMGRQSAAF